MEANPTSLVEIITLNSILGLSSNFCKMATPYHCSVTKTTNSTDYHLQEEFHQEKWHNLKVKHQLPLVTEKGTIFLIMWNIFLIVWNIFKLKFLSLRQPSPKLRRLWKLELLFFLYLNPFSLQHLSQNPDRVTSPPLQYSTTDSNWFPSLSSTAHHIRTFTSSCGSWLLIWN